ncbi:MAG TPA: YifB family Mg chelatase-like AAA ATPase [Chloroflexota bacterium]|nr:YifB family Mg chelatase-like AAA ATPase [Chloroflexota bacterium]
MLAKVWTCAVVGLEGELVQVEVDIARQGLVQFNIVGLPDAAVQEARERVRAAVRNSGFIFPPRRITVNLAPAEIRKSGPSYDLPIAIGVLQASEQIAASASKVVFLGELSLDGTLRHLQGVLPMVGLARDRGVRTAFVPAVDAAEAALVDGIDVIPVRTLAELVDHLKGAVKLEPLIGGVTVEDAADPEPLVDLAHVKGQEHARRALEVAAAGGHNLLLGGPPGTGKTLLARAIPSILPRMTLDEALEVTRIYSVAGRLHEHGSLVRRRPFRAPHHTISPAGLVGGGVGWARPGELSLAHRGVLFLDEMPELSHTVLEVMRQPLEDGVVSIGRARGTVVFPARFMLVGAMNPCPCGYFGDPTRACSCQHSAVDRYQKRLSGPLLDRIDLHIDVPRVEYEKLAADSVAESSAAVRVRVEAARQRQWARFEGSRVASNAEMGIRELKLHCGLDPAGEALLKAAVQRLGLSARAYHRVLKVSRTVADLAGADRIGPAHLAEAIQYQRRSDR